MTKIVFMGTPDFAVPSLQALHAAFGVSAVVTVPDKPQGRGLKVVPSAVKQAAMDLGITDIQQPAKLRDPDFIQWLTDLRPDIICVIAFRILPRDVYQAARLGSFNVHASLLPKFRGAAPINHAIINGETVTGVTSFLLNDVVDTGTILRQITFDIPDGMTAGELYDALKPLAADCAVATCRDLTDGTAVPQPQDDALACPAPKVFRETSVIDWDRTAHDVRNFIHGHSPVPGAWTLWNGEPLKIFHVRHSDHSCKRGMFRIVDGSFVVGCADGALEIEELQLPGKRRMMVSDVVRGYRGPQEGSFS